jgi:hypothetical protein
MTPIRSLLEIYHHVHLSDLFAGRWFDEIARGWLQRDQRKEGSKLRLVRGAENRTEEARRLVRRACAGAAVLATGAATINTGAGVVTANTSGAAAPIVLPIAGLSTAADTMTRVLVHLRMAQNLLDLYGVSEDPEELDELGRLLALGYGLEPPVNGTDRGRALLEHLMRLEWTEAARVIGAGLLSESVLRNTFPFINLLASPLWSLKVTRDLAHMIEGYARHRRVLDDAYAQMEETSPEAVEVFLAGLWFVFTADGRLTREEAAIMSRLLRRQTPAVRQRLMGVFGRFDGADDWFGRLAELDPVVRAPLLHGLELAAAADSRINAQERDVLHRAAAALRQPLDDAELDTMAARLAAETAHPHQPHPA